MLRVNQLSGFGAGASGLGPLTHITATMWDGSTSGWTLSNSDGDKSSTGSGGAFSNIRIKHATAPVLDGDFAWQYIQTGNGGGNTDSSWGLYDVSEDSTWNSTAYQQGLNSMTNSYWMNMDGSLTFATYEGSTALTAGISFSTSDVIKFTRTGSSLKLFVDGVQKQESTSVTATLRFCVSGYTAGAADFDDMQYQV